MLSENYSFVTCMANNVKSSPHIVTCSIV